MIVSDDFCEDLSMRDDLTGDIKTAHEKISQCYKIAHSESPNHTCHHVHSEWRKIKNDILTPASAITAAMDKEGK